MLSENKGIILNIDVVLFSSSIPVGVKSPPLEGVWPLLFIGRPLIRRTKVGFHLGSGNLSTACMNSQPKRVITKW